MLDLKTILQLLTKIAKSHTGHPLSLNSFALVNSYSDIGAINANQGVDGHGKGYYWNRKGVTRNNDKKDYPTLFLLKRRKTIDLKGNNNCIDLAIGVAVPEECKPCGKNFTAIDAERLAEQILCDVIQTFCEMKIYNVVINEDGQQVETTIIAHPNELECYDIVRNKGICGTLKERIDTKELSVVTSKYGSDKLQLSSAEIRICQCVDVDLADKFDWKKEDKQISDGIVKCESCF